VVHGLIGDTYSLLGKDYANPTTAKAHKKAQAIHRGSGVEMKG
jgi:hypothetical protein